MARRELADRFRDRLLMIDSGGGASGGARVGVPEARGQPLPVIDSPSAATSVRHDRTVVTRNRRARYGARCLNPWVGK